MTDDRINIIYPLSILNVDPLSACLSTSRQQQTSSTYTKHLNEDSEDFAFISSSSWCPPELFSLSHSIFSSFPPLSQMCSNSISFMRTTFNQLPSSQSISIAFKSFPPHHTREQQDDYCPAENYVHKSERWYSEESGKLTSHAKPRDRPSPSSFLNWSKNFFFFSIRLLRYWETMLCYGMWYDSVCISSASYEHHLTIIKSLSIFFSLSFLLHSLSFSLTIQFILLNHKEKSSQFYLTASLFL